MKISSLSLLFLVCTLGTFLNGQVKGLLPMAKPEAVGLDPKKLEAVESSCAPLQDRDCSISRIMDCSTPCSLKNYDYTSVDSEGKNLHDMADTLGRASGRG